MEQHIWYPHPQSHTQPSPPHHRPLTAPSTSTVVEQLPKPDPGPPHSVPGGADPSSSSNSAKTRGWSRQSQACVACRKMKMRCLVEDGGTGQCVRCKAVNRECVFVESQRGRKRPHEDLDSSLRLLEKAVPRRPPPPPVPAAPSSHSSHSHPSSQHVSPSEHALSLSGSQGHQGREEATQKAAAMILLHGLPHPEVTPLGLLADASLQSQSRSHDDSRPHSHFPNHGGGIKDSDPTGIGGSVETGPGTSEGGRHNGSSVSRGQGGGGGPSVKVETEEGEPKLGVANTKYFHMNNSILASLKPSTRAPAREPSSHLPLLTEKIITAEQVHDLFALYYNYCHQAAPVLDPELHTVSGTARRSGFLFTCVCAVASRYYTPSPPPQTQGSLNSTSHAPAPPAAGSLYTSCLASAKKLAAEIITTGTKSTDIVLGFFLLAQWNQPAESFARECLFQFSGVAIRMGVDLNLHCKPLPCPPEVSAENRAAYERETRLGERTWLYAYIADRSISNQLGKPYSISRDDLIIRHAKQWHLQGGTAGNNGGRDLALSAVVELQKIITRAIDVLYSDMREISGLNRNLDYPRLMRSFLGQLDEWRAEWGLEYVPSGPLVTGSFLYYYYRLFLLSFAIQNALSNPDSLPDLAQYCALGFESAASIIQIATESLEPRGQLRHAIDCTFVFLTFACLMLLKFISPIFTDMVDPARAMQLVEEGTLALEKCAVDSTHTPALYASFLRVLMRSKRGTGPGSLPASRVVTRAGSPNLHTFGTGHTLPHSPVDSGIHLEFIGGGHNFLDGANGGHGAEGEGMADLEAFLSDGQFWDTMVMPGYGGPIQSLQGGTLFPTTSLDPWDQSGQPNLAYGDGLFNFDQVNLDL
ncbi:hypothetical protein T439DRAFT_322106 [Meredithblackwellia eburnea MCA 4105]